MEHPTDAADCGWLLAAERLSSADPEQFLQWLRARHAEHPKVGAWLLLAEQDRAALPELQARADALGVPLVGAVFPAVIDETGIYDRGLVALAWRQMPPYVLLQADAMADDGFAVAVGDFVASASRRYPDGCTATLFMLFDAMLPNIGSMLDALYLELADRVRYVGVNAGSETFTPMPCLFGGMRCIQGGMLAALLPPAGIELAHGYREPDEFVAATATSGNRIREIDWQPAFDIYRQRIHAQFGIEVDASNFYSLAVHFPFGIQRADGEVLVRIPVALEEDGSVFCVGEVPEHAIMTLLEAPTARSGTAAADIALGLGPRSEARTPPLMTFYCAGRRLHFGDAAAVREVRDLSERLGGRTLAGALSLGEIGSSHRGGYPLFHNATIVAVDTTLPGH